MPTPPGPVAFAKNAVKAARHPKVKAPLQLDALFAEARKIMESLGYGPNKRLKVKVSTRDFQAYKDPAVLLVDKLHQVWFDAELLVMPGETRTYKWTPKKAGVFPFYCTDFCSALHQEMQGYLIVKPR